MTENATSTIPPARKQPDPPRPVGRWERISFAAAHASVGTILACTSLSGLYRFGRAFGTLEWAINFKRRRRFAAALRHILGEEPTPSHRRSATREFFRRTRCDKLFYLVFDRVPCETAPTLLTIGNRVLLDNALAGGRGVYLALSHHGSQHVLALLMALQGYKTAAVRDGRESALRRYVQRRFDEQYPDLPRARWLFADAYPREIFRCLQDGFVLGSAMDVSRVRGATQKTEEVTYFGEKRNFLSGPMHIALRCRAPVLQAVIKPEADFRMRLEILETLLDPDQVQDKVAAVTEAMQRYAANLERHVRAAPSLITKI